MRALSRQRPSIVQAPPSLAQALHERLAILQQSHHDAEPDLRRRAGKRRATATTPARLDQPGLRKALHDLGQVVARQPVLVGQIGGRESTLRCACHAHQHTQAIVGKGSKAHRRERPR